MGKFHMAMLDYGRLYKGLEGHRAWVGMVAVRLVSRSNGKGTILSATGGLGLHVALHHWRHTPLLGGNR